MATNLGGWYLNGSTLQYRLLNGETLTSTVLASITGLTGLKMEEGKVKVRGANGWDDIGDNDIVIRGDEGDNTSTNKGEVTFKISDALLGTSKISVSGSTNYTAYLDLVNDASKVHIDGTETIEFNKTAGTAVIKADVTKGFTLNKLDGKATSATYSNAAVNQTLATVSGLAKNYTASTAALTETTKDSNGKVTEAGTVTLSKTSTAGEVSALGTTAIKVAMTSLATANGINYYLKLGEASGKTYKQVSANDEAPYWSVKGTTATYQYYSPTGYELANAKGEIIATGGTVYKSDGTAYQSTDEPDSNATQIKVTAAKTTTVATVTGLASDLTTNVTDRSQVATAVGTGRARITDEFQSGLTTGTITKPTYKADGKTLETDTDGTTPKKGTATVNISKAVLPIKGNVVVTSGKDFNVSVTTGNDFYEATDNDGTAPTEVKTQNIWVINGTTATYKEVDLAYYKKAVESTDRSGNKITTITCVPQTTGTVLATITGLNADWLEKSGNLTTATKDSSVITAIKGITVTDGKDAVMNGRTVVKAAIPGSIKLSSEVLGTTNVTIAKSNNYRLNLATTDDATAGTTKVALPTFSTYKWNLSGTTATLKGTVTAGYTSSDDGKTITYTAGGVNQTLATVSGLKKGTQLERETAGTTETGNNDYRKIGNHIGDEFVEGLSIETDNTQSDGQLAYKEQSRTTTAETPETYKINVLDRMAITLSKHVMDGKVTLNSNFFTLAVNKVDGQITSTSNLEDKAASRTYVLEKYTDNVYAYNSETKKDVLKDGADAIIGWHGSLGATATLKQSAPACYELVTDEYGTTKTINYTKPGTAKTLATITGLNKDITENDIEVGTTPDTDGKYIITIKNANALTTSNVKITMPAATTANPTPPQYKLALATDPEGKVIAELGEATLSALTWTQLANGTVNFATKVTGAGYKLNADENTITYTKAATTAATLATISGLKPGLTPTNTANTPFEGVVFNQEAGTIALSKSALNNAKVTLSGAGNYKLIINKDASGDDIEDTSENYIVTEKPDPVQGWVINGTSAIYKTVTPEYYEYNAAANTLTYVKPVDSKYQNDSEKSAQVDYTTDTTKVGRTIPALGTIKGLKAGLTVNRAGDKIGYYKDGAFVEAISFDTNGKTIIIKDDGVLDYKNSVTLDAAAIATGYSIKLDDTVANGETASLADTIKPGIKDGTTATWSISRGTATYKGDVKAGYATAGDHKSIIFSAEKTNTAIATITGLDTTLTEVGDGLAFGTNAGTTDNTNVITVKNSMLGTTNAKLTTNIAILGKNYKLALDAYNATSNTGGVKGKEDAKGRNIWSISGTTATYGTYRDDYYSLNNKTTTEDTSLAADEPADTITYHKAGVASDDKLATVTGLVSGLVTIQNDQIRGITVDDTEGTITLSSNVLPTTVGSTVKVTGENSNEYELALDTTDTSIPTPQNSCLYGITKAGNATLTITRAYTAGFAYDKDGDNQEIKTTLVYKPQDDNDGKGLLGTITGLNKDIEVNKNGGITGIVVTEGNTKTITLSRAVLTNGDAKLTSSNGYKLVAGSDITAASGAPIWESTSTKGKYNLRTGATAAGYEFKDVTTTDGVTTQIVKYEDGGDGGELVATVSGLKNTTDIKVDETEHTITIVPSALNAQTIKIEPPEGQSSTEYKLAIETTEGAADYVAPPKTTNTWTLVNGTATFTQAVFAGYKLDQSGDIVYTPASSIVSTFTGLSKEITNAEMSEGTSTGAITLVTDSTNNKGIVFTPDDTDPTKGTFEVTDENILAHKNVKLTVKPTGKNSEGTNVTADYTLTLGSGIAAKTDAPIWNKANNATSATLTATTAAGYSLGTDGKSITYSSDPTTATLATVSGLNKESVVNSNGTAIGIEAVTDATTDPVTTTFTAGLEVTKTPDQNNGIGEITIRNNVLNGTKVGLLKNDKYEFKLDTTTSGNEVPTSTSITDNSKVWVLNRTAATYKNVTPAYYTLNDTTKQEITYTPQKDKNVEGTSSPNVVTVSGLKSGIKLDSSGNVINADGSTSKGLTNGTNVISLSSAVLGTSKITSDNKNIQLDPSDTSIINEDGDWENQTEWVGSGTTYTYKTYNKAYYENNPDNNKEILYHGPTTGTTFATITGLNSGLTNTDISYDSTTGTITLGKKQLGTSTVNLKITSGDFKLALDAEEAGVSADPDTETGATASNKVDKSTIVESGQTWTTNKTTATLTGTKTKGYTLSEDAKSITYQATDKVVTLATVKGIKSGAEIAPTDVTEGTGDDADKKIITLNKTQLGTANVTVTGDGYKLALDDDAISQTDDAAWVKAANTTKATFTQKTYNGFIESTDGKSLTYLKATTNVDLATINGLSKDLTTAQMAIVNSADAANTELAKNNVLVVLNTETKEITVKKDALSGKVTLGNKDDYTLKLYGATNSQVGGEETPTTAPKTTFNKSTGTMSIVTGTAAIWKETADGKSLDYTPEKYTTVATITGIPKTLDADATTGAPTGITVGTDGKITIAKTALFDSAGTTSLLANNGKITLTNYTANGGNYTLEAASDSGLKFNATAPTAADKKKWVLNGTKLSLKEVTSAYYTTASAENTRANTKTQTITYVAEKVGGDLAVITGLPTNSVQLNSDSTAVYVANTTNAAFTNNVNSIDSKDIELSSYLRNAISSATTFTLTSSKGYKFSELPNGTKTPTTGSAGFNETKSYTTLGTKGNATLLQTTSDGWKRESDTKIVYTASTDSVVATFNGLNKNFNPTTNNTDLKLGTGADSLKVTVGKTALTNSNVTVTIPRNGTVYNLALGSAVATTMTGGDNTSWKNQTEWVVSGGTANYKTYDKENYYIKAATSATAPNSIVYVKPTAGTSYAAISGMNKNVTSITPEAETGGEIIIRLGAEELEGTSKVTLKTTTPKTVAGADALNAIIAEETVKSAKFRLALDTTTADSITASTIEQAVWDNNGKVANLTGTIKKGYRLSNDQMSVSYQSADSKLQVVAKVTGIKSGSQISDSNVSTLADSVTGYNANLPDLQYITLKEEHLSTDNIVLTGEGFKLSLDGGVITNDEEDQWKNQTEWVNSNGTFTYKTYNKANYKLDTNGMRVSYNAAKDDKTNTSHKTYLTISGLSKNADATIAAAAKVTNGAAADDYKVTSITSANDGVISLSSAVLNKANVKLTDSQNGGYSLVFATDAESLKSTVSNDSAVISGNKATWTGTQGKGYLLANDGQNITYYSTAKTKQNFATVTGLASSVTSANNDAFSGKYDASTNTVSLGAADLGDKVAVGGTAAFDFTNYKGFVTGSNAADKMTFAAGNNTINALGGNDVIDVASKGNNVFLYANGNGNDVIKGFEADSDIIRVTNVVGTPSTTKKVNNEDVTTYTANIEVYQDDKITTDAIVRVNKNYIRLKGVNTAAVKVYDSKGNIWDSTKNVGTLNGSFVEDTSGNSNVLADDNYAMTPTAQLSSIVKSSTSDYMADDLAADDATALTKQSTAVSYSDKK